MRSPSPQPRACRPQPHLPVRKTKSGIPKCGSGGESGTAPSETSIAADSCSTAEQLEFVYKENQFLGRLVQELQAKLDVSRDEVQRLNDDLFRSDATISKLQSHLEDTQKQLCDAENDNEAFRSANKGLAEQNDSLHQQNEKLESVVVDLNLRLQSVDEQVILLQARCTELQDQLAHLQANTTTAEHVRQQLQRVETMYHSRIEAIKHDYKEKLAAQELVARTRLTDAQAAATEALSRVKQGVQREVQRADGLLQSKLQDQLRVLEQLAKRCQALESRTADMRPLVVAAAMARDRVRELEKRLLDAEVAAATAAAVASSGAGCCCCCCCRCGEPVVQQPPPSKEEPSRPVSLEAERHVTELQSRLAELRGDLAAQAETLSQLQVELAAAQQSRVVAEERLEGAEAACRELRTENVALRTQLLAVAAPDPGRRGETEDREAAADAAALRAAEADAAARELLQSARREQVATSRALMSQLRRVQALESMRLSDLQEMHRLESRLAALNKLSGEAR